MQHGKVEVVYADFACHQFVEHRVEEVVKDGAFAPVQVDFAVEGIKDGHNLVLFGFVGGECNL